MLAGVVAGLALAAAAAAPPDAPEGSPAIRVGAFGGLTVTATRLVDDLLLVPGFRAGIAFDDRWILGAIFKGSPQLARGDQSTTRLWQAGALFEWAVTGASTVRPRIGYAAGLAFVNTQRRGDLRTAAVFFIEPHAGVDVRVTRALRLGVTAGYRAVLPAPNDLSQQEVNGFALGVTADFGAW